MAETALTVGSVSETELDVTTLENADTSNNNSAANLNGDVMLLLDNPGASTATVTVTAQTTSKNVSGYGPMTKADKVVTLTTGQTKLVGPFPAKTWNDGNGNLIITAGGAGAADVDLKAFRIA